MCCARRVRMSTFQSLLCKCIWFYQCVFLANILEVERRVILSRSSISTANISQPLNHILGSYILIAARQYQPRLSTLTE